MEISYLRASTIGTYKDCPFKFFLHYVVGIPSLPNKKAHNGSCVHHCLEILARAKKTGHYKLNDKYTDPEYILKICWDRYSKMHTDLFEMDDKDYEFCREQMYNVLNSRFNPLNLNILQTEDQFDIGLNINGFECKDGKNLRIRGTIDLVTELDEDTIEVIDYKTGQRLNWIKGGVKEWEDFLQDTQLRMYDLATSKLYEQYKYRLFTIIFTRDGGPFTVTFTDDELLATVSQFYSIFKEIENDNQVSRLLDNRERADQRWKCNYVCQFGKMTADYISEGGTIAPKNFKPIHPRRRGIDTYPDFIEESGEYWHRITDHERLCDKLYNDFKYFGQENFDKVIEKRYNYLRGLGDESRRNDYSNSKLTQLTINRNDLPLTNHTETNGEADGK